MKKFRYVCLIFIILPLCFLLVGCGKVFVTDIEKTGSNGGTDIYTIYYSDGSTSTLSVENGKDGQDGADLDLKALYDLCVENDLYTGDFQSFLQDYVSNRAEDNSGLHAAMNSVVSVYSAFKVSVEKTYYRSAYSLSAGAGVIYEMGEADSYVLTNCHVVTNYESSLANKLPETIMIWQYGAPVELYGTEYLPDSGYYSEYDFVGGVGAQCVGYSIDYDLAILKVKTADLLAFNADACAVSLADSYSVSDEVYAIGNPEAEGISVTSGVVSVVSEDIAIPGFPADNLEHTFRCMRIDVPIYHGNSGGGLFNKFGKLVGIINAGWATTSEIADNYNYALPLDSVKQVAKMLIYYAKTDAPQFNLKHLTMRALGASVGEEYSRYNAAAGELVFKVFAENVSNSGTLADCGLQRNDVLESVIIDGTTYELTRAFQVDDLLILARADSHITFNVLRGSEQVVVNLLGFEI